MKLKIEEKENKIFVNIELVLFGKDNAKKQKYYQDSVETLLETQGYQFGSCLKNSVIHNLDPRTLKGEWIFEKLKPPSAITVDLPVEDLASEAVTELAGKLKKSSKKKTSESA